MPNIRTTKDNITVSMPSYSSLGEKTVHTNKWYLWVVTIIQYNTRVKMRSIDKVLIQSRNKELRSGLSTWSLKIDKRITLKLKD